MEWERVKNRSWKAVGNEGVFYIEQSGQFFWSRYISQTKAFRMPPKRKLSEAKAMCEDCYYWEEKKNAAQ